jgi:hypothetical protein
MKLSILIRMCLIALAVGLFACNMQEPEYMCLLDDHGFDHVATDFCCAEAGDECTAYCEAPESPECDPEFASCPPEEIEPFCEAEEAAHLS